MGLFAIWIIINNLSSLTTSVHNNVLFMRIVKMSDSCGCGAVCPCLLPGYCIQQEQQTDDKDGGGGEEKKVWWHPFLWPGGRLNKQKDPNNQPKTLQSHKSSISTVYKHVQCGYVLYVCAVCVCTCMVCISECASIFFCLYLCKKEWRGRMGV